MKNPFAKIAKIFNTKAEYNSNDVNSVRTFFGSGETSITANNAQKIAAVFSCVNIKANALAVIPIHTYKISSSGKVKDKTNPLYNILRYEPNENLISSLYKKIISQDLDLRGNHYSQIRRNGNGEIVSLNPLVSDNMELTISSSGRKIFKYSGAIIQSNRVLHVYDVPDVTGHKGLSKIEYAKQSLEFANNTATHGNKVFKNATSPSGAFETDQTLNDESFNRLKDSIVEKYTGLENTGTPLLLEGGLSFKPLSIKNSDAEWLESKKFNREEVASIFGVPVAMLNDATNSAYGNLEQKFQEFYSGTIFPLTTILEEQFRQSLLSAKQKQTLSIKFKYNTMLRVDTATRATYYQTRFNTGSMTPNEIRAYEDENSFDDGNESYLQLNLSTVKNLNKGTDNG
jgi:HK97 family phage portal protein